jgi:hypothetical protein
LSQLPFSAGQLQARAGVGPFVEARNADDQQLADATANSLDVGRMVRPGLSRRHYDGVKRGGKEGASHH